MARYERSVRVAAPFDAVWDFHSTTEGLIALTPDWMHLEIESVHGPDGEQDPEVLETESRITSSVRPFDTGPRQQWVSVITGRNRHDGAGYFRDEMHDGPFEEWTHTHAFYADGAETVIRDLVEYKLPFIPQLGPLAHIGFEPMFRYRHRQTRERLE
jgi:ligand-binding SRPBCC domain-containing protein